MKKNFIETVDWQDASGTSFPAGVDAPVFATQKIG
jgi:hypothetical protein